MTGFDDRDFATDPAPAQAAETGDLTKTKTNESEGGVGGLGRGLSAAEGRSSYGAVEVPASRPSVADASPYMHQLSLSPSQRDRRGSRNSFGAALPIPRSKRQSRLSSVHHADG
ncbi:uncharacterized protein CLAFUR5_10344 [Fulvia fulva]|uniref:Uncharacterized protein n=1 Tax=Passalora fulva TaxID=5499 RepID=A0A9Q8PCT6_PASFU|nr:uncharacterized protein CLAFUR5_10344 [Fulvia fulva]KAK4620562.1 hypothetical protein CLAFUR0_11315 [Fulvia fulva]UJO20062.1 hypothetical protein CLAFUR5_10344 [Fulvia fulva]